MRKTSSAPAPRRSIPLLDTPVLLNDLSGHFRGDVQALRERARAAFAAEPRLTTITLHIDSDNEVVVFWRAPVQEEDMAKNDAFAAAAWRLEHWLAGIIRDLRAYVPWAKDDEALSLLVFPDLSMVLVEVPHISVTPAIAAAQVFRHLGDRTGIHPVFEGTASGHDLLHLEETVRRYMPIAAAVADGDLPVAGDDGAGTESDR